MYEIEILHGTDENDRPAYGWRVREAGHGCDEMDTVFSSPLAAITDVLKHYPAPTLIRFPT